MRRGETAAVLVCCALGCNGDDLDVPIRDAAIDAIAYPDVVTATTASGGAPPSPCAGPI